jgi:CelD/BcsL family acetyltransferase involved in cellulose biosynthesis
VSEPEVDHSIEVGSVETLAPEWRDLAERTAAPPWAWPEWFGAWQRAFSPNTPLVAYVARSGGRLSGVGAFRWQHRRLEAAANVHSPWWGVLAEDQRSREAVFAAALRDRPTRLELHEIRERAGEAEAVRACASRQRYRFVESVFERAPFVRGGRDWHTYYRTHIDRHRRREIDRCRRRLMDAHRLDYEWAIPDPDTVDKLLDDGFRVEASGWKGRAGTAILSDRATASFYRELARWSSSRGWLRLGFLRADGRAAAFELALEKDGVISLLKGGYDEALSRMGPGILLLHDLLEDAFARGIREVDLLGGSERYKLQWADATRSRSRLSVFSSTPRGTAEFGLRRLEIVARAAARSMKSRGS